MKKIKLWWIALTVCVAVMSSCSSDKPASAPENYFSLWNDCEALAALQEYVTDVTNPDSPNFIAESDRIATFDMDGTFVGELYPTYFEYNLLEYRVLEDTAYRDKVLRLGDRWREAGYIVISMRDDFKTIYGYGVEKTDFSF